VNASVTGLIVFVCVFGGALLGIYLRAALPAHHLNTDSRDLVKLGTGLIATMAALVLGLLVASAKSSYDAQSHELVELSAHVVLLDRLMAHYGPETGEARALLRRGVERALAKIWPEDRSQAVELAPSAAGVEVFYDKILELAPQNDVQRSLQVDAARVALDLGQTRWLLFEQRGSSIPMPFLVVLVFWLTIIFISFGLFAPRNATVIAVLFVCALSVAGAIFMILELDRPFEGLIRISSAPLRSALTHLGQ
jgi:hypothetical protein